MIYFYTDLNRYLLKIETKLRNGKEQKQSPKSVSFFFFFFFLKKLFLKILQNSQKTHVRVCFY